MNGFKALNGEQIKKIKNMMFDVANDQTGATHAWMKVEEGYITIEDNTPSKDDERMIDVLFTNKVDYLGYNFDETIYDFGTLYGSSIEMDIDDCLNNIKNFFEARTYRPIF